MKKLSLIIGILLFASTAFAYESWDPSFYAGLGYGWSKLDTGITNLTGTASLDEDDSGFKIFGGFKINKFLGLELAYNKIGKAELKGNSGDQFSLDGVTYSFLINGVTIEAEAKTIELAAIYFIPLDYFTQNDSMKYFEPFIKIGANFWEIEYSLSVANVGKVKGDDDGTDIVFGAGINFKVHENFTIRTEWERFKMEDNVDFFTLNLIFDF